MFFFVNCFFAQLVIVNLGILNPEDSSWIYCRWWFEQTVLMVLSTKLHDDTPLCGSYSTPPFFHWMISSFCPTDHLFSKDQKMESDAESSLKLRVCDIFTHIYIYIYTYIINHIYIYIYIYAYTDYTYRYATSSDYFQDFQHILF